MTAPSKLVALTLLTLCLAGCRLPDVLSTQPSEDDDIDGLTDMYATAGTSTQMDYGPGQQSLLDTVIELQAANRELERKVKELHEENSTLNAGLAGEGDLLQRERAQHAQTRAALQSIETERRSLQAQILSLSIEKAKLQQEALLGKIANLDRTLEELTPSAVVATSAPGGRR